LVNKPYTTEISKLVTWLNGPRLQEVVVSTGDSEEGVKVAMLRSSAVREMIEPLIELLNDMKRWSRYGPPSYSEKKSVQRMKRSGRRVRQRMNPKTWRLTLSIANPQIENCLVFPQITQPTKTGWDIRWLPDPKANEDQRFMTAAIQQVLSLAQRNLLSRVRRCAYEPCGRWFDGRNPKKDFHAEECRNKAHYADLTPETKEEKRKYMKRKMREWRTRNLLKAK
jgi:hypothetical protein